MSVLSDFRRYLQTRNVRADLPDDTLRKVLEMAGLLTLGGQRSVPRVPPSPIEGKAASDFNTWVEDYCREHRNRQKSAKAAETGREQPPNRAVPKSAPPTPTPAASMEALKRVFAKPAAPVKASDAKPVQKSPVTPARPVDTRIPHFAGSESDPHQFLVMPASGPDDDEQWLYRDDPQFIAEMGLRSADAIQALATVELRKVNDIASRGDDADDMAAAISEATGNLHDRILEALAAWQQHHSASNPHTERFLELDNENVREAIEGVREAIWEPIWDALYGDESPVKVAGSMDDDSWDPDAIRDAQEQAIEGIAACLQSVQNAMTELDSTIKAEAEKEQAEKAEEQESAAAAAAAELDEHHGDESDEANARAEYRRLQASTRAPLVRWIGKSFDESKHPRDPNGRFVSEGAILEAAQGPAKRKALEAKLSPDNAKKLDAAIRQHHAQGTA